MSVIGVDVGGSKLLAGTVDAGFGVHHRVRRDVPADDAGALIETLAQAIAEAAGASDDPPGAVGIGMPCLIDRERGLIASSVHLAIAEMPFADVLAERVGLPVALDNDANLALLAEHRRGAARATRNALMLTVGTGIGGAIVIDGRLYRGSRGAGAELGHIAVAADGPRCGPGCPSRGCLEALASGRAIEREARAAAARAPGSALAGRELSGALVTELAHDGDPDARAVLEAAGRWLGVGIASLINVFEPEVVVVGGGVIAAGELLLAPARAAVAERALPFSASATRIVAAHFGAESGMLGAAMYAYDELA